MKRQIDYDDLFEIMQDIKGIEALLIHVECSEYFKGAEEDTIILRAIRNSLKYTKNNLKHLMEVFYEEIEYKNVVK